jgi:putative ABC transport system permease protein
MNQLSFCYDVVMHIISSLRVNMLRSVLVVVSVAIGIAALILGMTFTSTLSKSLVWQFENLGSGTLTVSSYLPLSEQLKGKKAIITHKEFEQIKRHVSQTTEHVTPIIRIPKARIQFGQASAQPSAIGTTYNYMEMRSRFVDKGRFINAADTKLRRRSVVIGTTVAQDLGLKNPLGEYIKINQEWFVVVGQLEAKGQMFGVDLDDMVILPYETSQSLLGNGTEQDVLIQMKASDLDGIPALKERVIEQLRQLHQLSPQQKNDFKVETTDELLSTFNNIIKLVSATLIGVVGLSMVVAAVGMTNIFLLSINERVNEIGLYMALGAGRKFVASLFIIESSILTTLGGLLGILSGFIIALAAGAMLPSQYSVDFPFMLGAITTALCFLLGILVSLLPASKACLLTPSVALVK